MKKENKVIIEITSEGWETVVELKGKKFKEKHKKSEHGAQGIEGNFEDEEHIPEVLYDALNGFFQFDVMTALNEIDEDYE